MDERITKLIGKIPEIQKILESDNRDPHTLELINKYADLMDKLLDIEELEIKSKIGKDNDRI